MCACVLTVEGKRGAAAVHQDPPVGCSIQLLDATLLHLNVLPELLAVLAPELPPGRLSLQGLARVF